MIETSLQELKKSIDELTVAVEALLETHRASGKTVPLTNTVQTSATATTTAEPAPKPRKAKAPKVEEPAPAPEAATPTPEAATPAPEAAPAQETFTVQDLRAEAQKALDLGRWQAVVNLNKIYGVKRVSEVSPDLYPEMMAKLRLING